MFTGLTPSNLEIRCITDVILWYCTLLLFWFNYNCCSSFIVMQSSLGEERPYQVIVHHLGRVGQEPKQEVEGETMK